MRPPLLTNAQALAYIDAMASLEAVGGRLKHVVIAEGESTVLHVDTRRSGTISVAMIRDGKRIAVRSYCTFGEFAVAHAFKDAA